MLVITTIEPVAIIAIKTTKIATSTEVMLIEREAMTMLMILEIIKASALIVMLVTMLIVVTTKT